MNAQIAQTCRCAHHRHEHSIDANGDHGPCRVALCWCERWTEDDRPEPSYVDEYRAMRRNR
jgi:hypothetical protein